MEMTSTAQLLPSETKLRPSDHALT